MQVTVVIFTEFVNICVICNQTTAMDIIMNFIALGVIADIDNYYAGSLVNFPGKKCLENPPVIENFNIEFKSGQKTRSLGAKFIRIIYLTIRMWFVCFYFYFMALLVVPLSYLKS